MLRLLSTFDRHDCTDERDRSFTLYSMANDNVPTTSFPSKNKIYMEIDYTSDVKTVFKRLALASLIRGRHKTLDEGVTDDLLTSTPEDQEPSIIRAVLERRFSEILKNSLSWGSDCSKVPRTCQPMLRHLELGFHESSKDDNILVLRARIGRVSIDWNDYFMSASMAIYPAENSSTLPTVSTVVELYRSNIPVTS